MAWTVAVALDEDKATVGAVSAAWNAGQPDEFAYSERLDVSNRREIDAFVVRAKAALKAREDKATAAPPLEAAVAAALNKAVTL